MSKFVQLNLLFVAITAFFILMAILVNYLEKRDRKRRRERKHAAAGGGKETSNRDAKPEP